MGNIGYTKQVKLLVRQSVKLSQIKVLAEEKYLKSQHKKESIQMFYKNKIVSFTDETIASFIEKQKN